MMLRPGQAHETQSFEDLGRTTEVSDERLEELVPPVALAGDRAYRSRKIVEQLESEGVSATIPEVGEKANDESHPGFDRETHRRRNTVERLIGWLKENRRVFSRHEKTVVNYLGMFHIAFIRRSLAECV